MPKIDPLQMERFKSRLLMALSQHVGRSRIIGMGELYEEVFGDSYHHRINDTKKLRRLITELRGEGTPICSDSSCAGGGYYVASTSGELNAYLEKDKKRALRILKKNAAMQKIGLPEYLGQVQLELKAK